jgi:Mrp family chromosome partitioning ATPase
VATDLDSTKPLGEKLVEAGLISQEDMDRVLELQQQSRAGLLDVLAGEPLSYCVSSLPASNLDVLSVGNATAEHVSRVGQKALRQFLDEVHEKYEAVLIDTGPAPGSVETSLIAAEADRVVLTVSRGDPMSALSECHKFLSSIGAHIAGVVYNRAEGRDVELSRFSVGTSMRSISQNSESARDRALPRAPVVTAVAGEEYGGSNNGNGHPY